MGGRLNSSRLGLQDCLRFDPNFSDTIAAATKAQFEEGKQEANTDLDGLRVGELGIQETRGIRAGAGAFVVIISWAMWQYVNMGKR